MSDSDSSWSNRVYDWASSSLVQNGVFLGLGFLAWSLYRSRHRAEAFNVTQVRGTRPDLTGEAISRQFAICEVCEEVANREEEREQLRKLMSVSTVPIYVVGRRDTGKSNMVHGVLERNWSGRVMVVDLSASPSEDLAGWHARMAEYLGETRYSIFQNALQVLFDLISSSSFNASDVEARSEDTVSVTQFREDLKLLEKEILYLSEKGPLAVFIDGLEVLSSIQVTERGRRAVGLFLQWLQALAHRHNDICVIACLQPHLYLEWMILHRALDISAVVYVPDTQPRERRFAAARLQAALGSSYVVSRFAPLEENRSSLFDRQLLMDLLQRIADNGEIPLEEALKMSASEPQQLLELVKNDILVYHLVKNSISVQNDSEEALSKVLQLNRE